MNTVMRLLFFCLIVPDHCIYLFGVLTNLDEVLMKG
jgi:hypothetical protein